MTIRLIQPRSEADWAAARRLLEEYARSLNLDLSFQNFAHEMEHLASEYAPPTGAFRWLKRRALCWGASAYVVLRRDRRDQTAVCDSDCPGAWSWAAPRPKYYDCSQTTWIRPPVAGYIAVHEGGSRVVRVPWVQAYRSVSIQPRPRDCLPATGASMKLLLLGRRAETHILL